MIESNNRIIENKSFNNEKISENILVLYEKLCAWYEVCKRNEFYWR